MPYKKTAAVFDASLFAAAGQLRISLQEVERRLAEGAKLELEHSSFNDPGGDYSKLLLDNQVIAYAPGY
jgi:hypothetical protein